MSQNNIQKYAAAILEKKGPFGKELRFGKIIPEFDSSNPDITALKLKHDLLCDLPDDQELDITAKLIVAKDESVITTIRNIPLEIAVLFLQANKHLYSHNQSAFYSIISYFGL